MQQNLWNLFEQKILITGGTHGIGRAIAEEFLKLNAQVFLVARHQETLTSLIKEWTQQGHSVTGYCCDVTDKDQRQELVKKVAAQWKELNILINNVGPNFKKPVLEYSLDEYQTLINSNMTSSFHLTQLCHPLLAKAKNASIINISGISSQMAFYGSGPYGMAKAGIESFTRSLAIELGPQHIRANAIVPGFITTPTFSSKYDDVYLHRAIQQIPLQRLGNAHDVAHLACFLAMPAAAYINGQCLVIDGGFSSYGF